MASCADTLLRTHACKESARVAGHQDFPASAHGSSGQSPGRTNWGGTNWGMASHCPGCQQRSVNLLQSHRTLATTLLQGCGKLWCRCQHRTASTSKTGFPELKTHRYQSDIHSSWKDNGLVGNTPTLLPRILLQRQTGRTVPGITLPFLEKHPQICSRQGTVLLDSIRRGWSDPPQCCM